MAKISKAEADYMDTSTRKHCEDCSMFRKPNDCTLVLGRIEPKGHCRYWKAKSKLPTTVG
jgi:hypothetical protein